MGDLESSEKPKPEITRRRLKDNFIN